MAFWRLDFHDLLVFPSLVFLAVPLAQFMCPLPAPAQALKRSSGDVSSNSAAVSYNTSASSSSWRGPDKDGSTDYADREPPLPETSGPAALGGNPEHPNIPPAAEWRQPPFSRIGIGADVSPLGIGIKSAIVLNRYFDARLMGNFFSYNSGRFELEGFRSEERPVG